MGDVCLLESCVHKQYNPNECSFPSVVFSPLKIKLGHPSCRRCSSSKICWISCIDSEITMLEVTINSSTKLMMSFVAVRHRQPCGCLCSRTFHLGDVNSWFNDNMQFLSRGSLPNLLTKRSCDLTVFESILNGIDLILVSDQLNSQILVL